LLEKNIERRNRYTAVLSDGFNHSRQLNYAKFGTGIQLFDSGSQFLEQDMK